jgi:methylmalonyl-CoA mutase
MTSPPRMLAEGFPDVNRGQWHELVAKAMARSRQDVSPDRVESLLGSRTEDGYTLKPLYTAADVANYPAPADPGLSDYRRGARPAELRDGWSVRQRYWGSAQRIREALAEGLASGVDAVWLTLLPDLVSVDEIRELLQEIDLSQTNVTLEAFDNSVVAAAMLLDASEGKAVRPGTSLGLDPLAGLAGTGQMSGQEAAAELACKALDRSVLAYSIDATVYHEAGASFGEELGAATAAGLSTLRTLVDAGLTVDEAASLLEFRFAVTDDQFASIAKLRAARLLWNRVLEVAGASEAGGQTQHAVTSWSMLTKRDIFVNLIRNTVGCFAAGTGGADAVTVQPHTMACEFPDEFAHRMARNTQHLLLAEAHIGVVDDPIGGSWYGETRTRELAEAAWEFLQDIEGSGGFVQSLDSVVANRINRTWQLESERLAKRASPITGVSEFPDADRSATDCSGAFKRPGGGLPQRRRSEAFEVLRDRSDQARAHGQDVRVLLITVGSLASYSARVGFATNLFAAGGIDVVEVPFVPGEQLKVPESHTAPTVMCVCGSDSDYESLISELADGLPPDRPIWLAGRPADHAVEYADAGITGYLYAGCNALEVLSSTLADLEVSQ